MAELKNSSARILAKQEGVRNCIFDMIADCVVGERFPTETEIGLQLGVSPSTVFNAMQEFVQEGIVERRRGRGTIVLKPGHPLVVKATRDRVMAFVGLFAQDARGFGLPILHGAEEAARGSRFLLIYKQALWPGSEEAEVDTIQRMRRISQGMILYSSLRPRVIRLLKEFHRAGFPVVNIDHYPVGIPSNAVCSDNEQGGALAVRHLLDLGHRRIAFVMFEGDEWSSTRARMAGYRETMHAAGLLPQIIAITKEQLAGSQVPLPPPLTGGGRITGVVAVCDSMAATLGRLLLSSGLKIPDDISITGFDDDPEALSAPVPLTTLRQPESDIGRRAVALLKAMIRGEVHSDTKVLLPVELVKRASTGPAPGK